MNEAERKDVARRHLDAAEAWMRQLIQSRLTKSFGPQFFAAKHPDGSNVINNGIRQHVAKRRGAEPTRFPDDLAAIEFGHAVSIILNQRLYDEFFRAALRRAFPDGRDEAQTFLDRLEKHRNLLAHGGACSERVFQQSVCYSNDLIDSLKENYVEANLDKLFNVPTFTRVVDNLGNERRFVSPSEHGHRDVDFRTGPQGDLNVGDTLILEVEVDPSFKGYTVKWHAFTGDSGEGLQWELPIQLKHVRADLTIRATVVSAENWHKLHGDVDDIMDLRYRVLPPPR